MAKIFCEEYTIFRHFMNKLLKHELKQIPEKQG